MASNLKIHRLRLEDGERARVFLRAQYGENFYGADEAYFDWLYCQSPCDWFEAERAQGHLPINAVLTETGDIGAIHAFVPFDCHVEGTLQRGVWDLEWINGSGIKGAGRALAEHLLENSDVYAGFGCNDLSQNAFAKMGMQFQPEISRLVFVLNAEKLRARVEEAGLPCDFTSWPRECAGLEGGFETFPDLGKISETALGRYNQAIDFGVSRSRAWLEWRFVQNPYLSYQVITIPGQEHRAFAVIRLEDVLGSSDKVARILELHGEPGAEQDILSAAIAFACAHDCLICDYFNTNRAYVDRFSASVQDAKLPCAMTPDLPFMFQPLDRSAQKSINCVFANPKQARALESFFATKADANQDILRSPSVAAKLRANPEQF